jgi:hypothetical protein
MASVSAFCDMLGQFLTELGKCWPEEQGIKKFATQFELLRSTAPRTVVDLFMKSITPYVEHISARDESFLLEQDIDFLKDLNIKKNWAKTSDKTKGAIWQYLQTLHLLGMTISAVPQETLSAIENIAKDCADKMEQDGGGLDEAALMKSMTSMLGGLLNNKM